jgi:hypothetical protein
MVSTYYNPENPDGVAIDGQNDEVFGNSKVHVGPDGVSYDGDDDASDQIRDANGGNPIVIGKPAGRGCDRPDPNFPDDACIANDIDTADPTFSGVNAGLNWEEVAGPNGTLVTRTSLKQVTPGGAQGVIAIPYYRDDACFDDGTGSNPGPHLHGHGTDEGPDYGKTETGEDRRCWQAGTDVAPAPPGDRAFFQGSIATHGVHILFIAESDNARATVPTTEIDSEQRIVVLQPTLENVGESYGRGPEKPLVAAAVPELRDPYTEPEPGGSASPTPTPTSSSTSTSGSSRPASPGPSGSPTPTPTPTPVTHSTQLDFTATSAQAADYSDSATIAARLVDDKGKPIKGEIVTFELKGDSGSMQWTDLTDSSGVATRAFDVIQKPGAYEVTAHFSGRGDNTGSSDVSSFVVFAEDTAMALDRSAKKLVATLSDPDAGGLADRTVMFAVGRRVVGTTHTGADGVAKVTLPKKYRKGDRQFRAIFQGDEYYLGSSGTR